MKIKGRPAETRANLPNLPSGSLLHYDLHNSSKVDRDLEAAHQALEAYACRGRDEFGVGVRKYLIMPDHMHFVRSRRG
jgi:hypothetical protein